MSAPVETLDHDEPAQVLCWYCGGFGDVDGFDIDDLGASLECPECVGTGWIDP